MEFQHGQARPCCSRNTLKHAFSMNKLWPRRNGICVASELKGPARRVLIGRPADWLSNESGVRRLVEALRQERGQPKVPELSELLQKYFRRTRRARGETMGDFILRKSEAYTRAQQSMARYMKEQGLGESSQGGVSSHASTGPAASRSRGVATPAPTEAAPTVASGAASGAAMQWSSQQP